MATRTIRADIPRYKPQDFIKLAERIIAKHHEESMKFVWFQYCSRESEV